MRVLVTRSTEDAPPLVAGLRAVGLAPVCVPLVTRRLFEDAVHQAAEADHDGWILTSAASVAALVHVRKRPRWIAAVGPATARALEEAGFTVDIVPRTATAAELGRALGDRAGQRVLYPRARHPSPGTLPALRRCGALIDDVVAYDNIEPDGAGAALRGVWPVDVVTALSGSVIRRLVHHLPAPWPDSVRLAVIGPRTAEVARELGVRVDAVAEPHTVDGLVVAVQSSRGQTPRGDTGRA